MRDIAARLDRIEGKLDGLLSRDRYTLQGGVWVPRDTPSEPAPGVGYMDLYRQDYARWSSWESSRIAR